MTENKASYRHIFKATGLFGGVQVFKILISMISSKFIAIFLGTTGVGIAGLLTSTTSLISSITGLGLNFSAVRDVSKANATGDETKISRVMTTFRRWRWFTGILGFLTVFIMAPWLSRWTFDNSDFTVAFMWLSCTLLFNALSNGQSALLQGMRKLKYIAKSSVIGSALGLVISVPIYYWIGVEGIVPTMIISSLTTLALTSYFANKIKVKKSDVTFKESFHEGTDMVKLGILQTVKGFASTFSSYLINIFISHTGSIADVGLFQAGFSITNRYVNMVFMAMGTDYYPSLVAVHQDNIKMRELVNRQAEMAMLILCPILIIFLSTTPLVIRIFYTAAFLPILSFVRWVMLGLLFKAVSWGMGFIILAKGNIKLFFLTEMYSIIIMLICNVTGYWFWGLEGLGISFFISYFLYFVLIFFVTRKKYEFKFSNEFIKMITFQFLMCLIAFLFALFLGFPWAYVSGAIVFTIVAVHSYKELDKRIALKEFLAGFLKKKNK